jgi:transmembrane sensor
MNRWIAPAQRLDVSPLDGVDDQIARVYERRRRRTRRRVIAGSLAATTVVAIATVLVTSGPARGVESVPSELAVTHPIDAGVAVVPAVDAPVAVADLSRLALGDGSVVTPLGADSKLLTRAVSDREVWVDLSRGGAHFEVPDRDGRRFVAAVGPVAVETHGAAFRVVIDQRQVQIFAERGQLVVHGQRGPRTVAAGETMTFVLPAPEPTPVPHTDPAPPPPSVPSSWRDDASRGDYAAAWTALAREPAIDSMVDLLAAGDVARLSGHPGDAVTFLMRALSLHADDPRAPLAAFTLGRVHLEDLGAPRDAAQAFARAFALGPDGPLAEDALAREVEAWLRAGETELARARAITYAQRYPNGRRIRAVRKFGGLDQDHH